MMTEIAVLQFSACQQCFVVDIDSVVEVAAMVDTTPYPGTNPAVLGVANRHGTPLPLIDMRRLLQCDHAPIDLTTFFVVLQATWQLVGLVVDEVDGVRYVAPPTHPTGTGYVRGMLTLEDRLVRWLDANRLLADVLPTGVTDERAP